MMFCVILGKSFSTVLVLWARILLYLQPFLEFDLKNVELKDFFQRGRKGGFFFLPAELRSVNIVWQHYFLEGFQGGSKILVF